ncbi:hypothetical protein HJ588_15350 [Flexivirga sp. ID2601S]|uniref:Uncharacterized protein n=1 Tax=Flexivirga aerilata TaxID=1656889 RepID=A0A849AMP2_9MICO|nr:hypothetical protein [Flexivirga aerilata]NNG40641.1 hypothetical protein [Flexivirga aerilata]
MGQTSPVVRRTTDHLLAELHRSGAQRTAHKSEPTHKLHPMRPYAEQLAYEQGAG